MALFKIFKGTTEEFETSTKVNKANDGFAYFTTDDGKFYIDISGDGTTDAIIGTNRIPLNANKADKDGSGNVITNTYAPLASPALTGTPTAPTASAGTSTTQVATTAFVENSFSQHKAMVFKGDIGPSQTITALPASGYAAGWTYRVVLSNEDTSPQNYAGRPCENGDIIIAIKDYNVSTSGNTDWAIIEHNIDGAVFIGAANRGSAVGTTTQPVYVQGDGTVTPITHSLEADINNGNANRMAYYDSLSEISSSGHYVNSNQIAINSGSAPSSGVALFANGDVQTSGNIGAGAITSTSDINIQASSLSGRINLSAAGSSSGEKGIYLRNNADTTTVAGLLFNQNNQISTIAQLATNLIPAAADTYTLGSVTNTWNNFYGNNITLGTTSRIYPAGINIHSDLGSIDIVSEGSDDDSPYRGIWLTKSGSTASGIGWDANNYINTISNFATNIVPSTTAQYALGAGGTTAPKRWSALYIGSADTYGSATTPIYWNNGVPTATTYSLNTTVPQDAIFTDEKVAQIEDHTSNTTYSLLLSNGAAGLSDITAGAKKSNTLTYNPSSGILSGENMDLSGELSVGDQAIFKVTSSVEDNQVIYNFPKIASAVANTPTPEIPSYTNDETLATTEFVHRAFIANDALVFKGILYNEELHLNDNIEPPYYTELPIIHATGWTYKVGEAGTYAGKSCNIGDTIYCVTANDNSNNNNTDNDWVAIQTAVEGPLFRGSTQYTGGLVLISNGTTGLVSESGYSIGASILNGNINKIAYYSSTNTIGPASTHYIDNSRIAINSTGMRTTGTGSETLYVNGDAAIYGGLRFYNSSGSNYSKISSTLSANTSQNVYLPNYAGNIYITHTGSTTAVGSSTQPVYVDTNGRITALGYTAGRLYYSESTTSFAETSHYATTTKLAINGAAIPDENSPTLYVNGNTRIYGKVMEGNSNTVAQGANSHAEGSWTIAFGDLSHAEGYYTTAFGNDSHAEGSGQLLNGSSQASIQIEGSGPSYTASSTIPTVIKVGMFLRDANNNVRKITAINGTTITVDSAFPGGSLTSATVQVGTGAGGSCSHSEGVRTTAYGNSSHTEGTNTIAMSRSQHVFGEYNIIDTTGTTSTQGTYVEIVGCGNSEENRKNARTLEWTGTESIAGNFLPMASNTQDIGNTDTYWNNLYINNEYINGGIVRSQVEVDNNTNYKIHHIVSPGGGALHPSQYRGLVTGALKINLPISWTGTMLRFSIDIYDSRANSSYTHGAIATYVIGGYLRNASGTNKWERVTAYSYGTGANHNLSVRFQYDNTNSKCCITIGEINTLWNYPQVIVRDICAGYLGNEASSLVNNWDISFVSSFTGLTETANTIVTNPAQFGASIFKPNSSGNFVRNWYFIGAGNGNIGVFPINTRKENIYTQNAYGIDNWYIYSAGSMQIDQYTNDNFNTLRFNGNSTTSGSIMRQILLPKTLAIGNTYTLTVKVSGIQTGTPQVSAALVGFNAINQSTINQMGSVTLNPGVNTVTVTITSSNLTSNYLGVQITSPKADNTQAIWIQAIKVEQGSVSTLCDQSTGNLLDTPQYNEEIYRCKIGFLTYEEQLWVQGSGIFEGNLQTGIKTSTSQRAINLFTTGGQISLVNNVGDTSERGLYVRNKTQQENNSTGAWVFAVNQNNAISRLANFETNIIPNAHNTYTLGASGTSSTQRHWKDAYIVTTHGSLDGNATTATTLQTARTITIKDNSGTYSGDSVSFNGSANIILKMPATIEATKLKTAVNLTIKDSDSSNSGTAVSFNGSASVNLLLPATIKATLQGNASTASALSPGRTINGTTFTGASNITTANWGTARNITIGNTTRAVNGSTTYSWSLSDIGAAAATHTHSYLPLGGGIMTGSIGYNHSTQKGTDPSSAESWAINLKDSTGQNNNSHFMARLYHGLDATNGNRIGLYVYKPVAGTTNASFVMQYIKTNSVAVTTLAGSILKVTYTADATNLTSGALQVSGGIGCAKTIRGNLVYGAVWNDYAEFRKTEIKIEPGRCIKEIGNDSLELTTKRLERGCEIVSDTFGFAIGETEECQTPIASSGRVLAYPYESREEFAKHIGWAVCSGPNGTVSIMTEEEEEKYPSRIIGTISAVPDYEEWGSGNVKVNGRVWIRIR